MFGLQIKFKCQKLKYYVAQNVRRPAFFKLSVTNTVDSDRPSVFITNVNFSNGHTPEGSGNKKINSAALTTVSEKEMGLFACCATAHIPEIHIAEPLPGEAVRLKLGGLEAVHAEVFPAVI